MLNLSKYPIENTAYTSLDCAIQRAENLAILGATNVIELCCGPSLLYLTVAYNEYGIKVTGNDIDAIYQKDRPYLQWQICDCFKTQIAEFNFIVFAPPLSKGCSGKREDALSFWEVTPKYTDAIKNFKGKNLCLTLPGKTLSIKQDREQLYKLLSLVDNYEIIPLKDKVNKYIDIYIKGK